MKFIAVGAIIALMALAGLAIEYRETPQNDGFGESRTGEAIARGAGWLASVQGADGGWGQDGSGTSYIRTNGNQVANGNDVANTAVAALALLEAGPRYRANVERAVEFVLSSVEASPDQGLSITDIQGTQIQIKLGPYIDTFLAATLLTEVDGTMSTPAMDRRVRRALEKVIAKIERNQKEDGSWNIDGGWAPVLGTSLASRSLFQAQAKGLRVDDSVLDRADEYALNAIGPVSAGGALVSGASAEAAGIPLYQSAQALEQLSRTEEDRNRNAREIAAIQGQLSDSRFVEGFGSVGGEEFFSYLNLSDGLKRAGGEAWELWRTDINSRILSLQNNDGSWAGHHCITGRVAVTSGAILNLAVNHEG